MTSTQTAHFDIGRLRQVAETAHAHGQARLLGDQSEQTPTPSETQVTDGLPTRYNRLPPVDQTAEGPDPAYVSKLTDRIAAVFHDDPKVMATMEARPSRPEAAAAAGRLAAASVAPGRSGRAMLHEVFQHSRMPGTTTPVRPRTAPSVSHAGTSRSVMPDVATHSRSPVRRGLSAFTRGLRHGRISTTL